MRNLERDILSPFPVQRALRSSCAESGYVRQRSYSGRTPSPEYPRPLTELDEPRGRVTIRLSSGDDSNDSPRLSSSPEEVIEREICEVRKDSALFLEEAEGLPPSRELLRTRAPRIVRPRRESSGYASNLGTFDEERRNSSTAEALQDLSAFLKERRRSSTKRLNSRIGVARADESLTEESVNFPAERMPTTEVYRKVSSAGLEMPNIEEVKEVLREEVPSREEDINRICSLVQHISVDDLSTQCRVSEEQTKSTEVHTLPQYEEPPCDITDSTRQLISTESPATQSSRNSFNRMTHQHSVPFSSAEDTRYTVTWRRPDKLEADAQATYDDDDDVSSPAFGDTRVVLPKPVKITQLLSTQSEDTGDMEPKFTDRRISLQISRQDDRLLPGSQATEGSATSAGGVQSLTKSKVRDATVTSIEDSSPVRKLSSPAEVGTSQRLLGDIPSVSVRPIYPNCPYSPYGSPEGSSRNRRRPLRESRRVSIDNRRGELQLNQYKLLDNIGQGSYGVVKLVYNERDEKHYAMKILSKKNLMKKAGIFGRMAPGRKGPANPLTKIYREIALLKKLDHPNVVKLVEVLDDPDEDNLYLVFELVQRGEVLQVPTDKPLDEETARKNFRDVVMGVEYLHYQRIVHRDIKPSNLLVDSDGRVKIADLGVSAELRASGELLSGQAGTPAFAAPETTTPGAHYSGTLCDIWSMGVTLYSLVTGRIPWDGSGSIIRVQVAVRTEPLKFPDHPTLSSELRDLISRMLAKDPAERISLPEIKDHPWLTNHGDDPLPAEADNCQLPVTVTDEEVEKVVTRVPKLDTIILIKTMLKQHSFQNPFVPKESGRTTTGGEPTSNTETTSTPKIAASVNPTETARSIKSERFQRSGRSNSAPDSYNWQTNGKEISIDSSLPPVTEASSQECELERR